jgi:penicillin-binding protein 1B
VLAVAFTIWVVHLDRLVTQQFQGRHWSVPARVYAAPLELYAGAAVSAGDLEEELRRLHYRPGDPAAGAGFYRRHGNTFDVHARRVRFIDEQREGQTGVDRGRRQFDHGIEAGQRRGAAAVSPRPARDRQRLSDPR